MEADLSFTHLIVNASLIVQLVMLLLVLISLASWTLIFRKGTNLRAARAAASDFEERFWSGGDLAGLHREVAAREDDLSGLENLFQAGFQEFARLRGQKGMEPMDVVEGAQRAMRVSLSREVDDLEQHLSFLATVGSTSPYIGLFGTVWGIMNAFRGLANAQQATLAMVAPGIAEALIATAMGLFAAIPAVVAYNRYANEAERLIAHYESFIDEFASILQRQAHP